MATEDNKNGVNDDSSLQDKNPVIETLDSEDTDFDKELEALENGSNNTPAPAPKSTKSDLEKAIMTGKSIAKRIKSLGGDPTELISDVDHDPVPAPVERPDVDTSQFVTKSDFARQEASKLAKSPSELNLIMWWVTNKGMSVADAHFMANKNKIQKSIGEVNRINTTVPANPGGGAGQRQTDVAGAPVLPDVDRRRVEQSGMVYDPAKKAWVGKRVQLRYDDKLKDWVNEKI